MNEGDRLMLILPLDHSFAHTVGIYACAVKGLSIYFADARGGSKNVLKNIPINIKEANPHFMLTVPALTGNFMNKMKEGVAAKGGAIFKLYEKGLAAGIKKYGDGYQRGHGLSPGEWLAFQLASKLIFKKFQKVFGKNFRYNVGGGALLDISQQRFFAAIGVPVFQGYGLTEATPIISAN
ncbi:AMP-binding protein, partial [Arthrospira platensis SPKY1]|nr:AMP-binding protein [Arthrospira platensis SPKY1]